MSLQTYRIHVLEELPWHNGFIWLPSGNGGGYLLHQKYVEDSAVEYWLYVIPAKDVTIEMYESLPESAPFELHNNQLIFMAAPTLNHQIVSANLSSRLSIFVDDNELGKLLYAPVDVHFPDKTVIQPDLLFVSENWREHFHKNGLHTAPDWAAEILSPSTQEKDQNFKLQLLSENGTVEYWVIHPEEKWVEQYVLNEESKQLLLQKKYEDEEEVIESVAISGFKVSLKKIFKDVVTEG